MKIKFLTKNKYQLARLALISIVFTCLLFVGYVPASMAQSEFEDTGIIINDIRTSDQIYANGNMQAKVTVFWTFKESVPEKEISSVKLVDKLTRQDIDNEGWNYKTGETDYNPANEYLHQLPLSSAKIGKVEIVPNAILQGDEPGHIDLFVNYEEENKSADVRFCVEIKTKSGYVDSTCDSNAKYDDAILSTILPIVYPPASWSLEIGKSSPQDSQWDSQFTFINLVNKESSYSGTQKFAPRLHVQKNDGLWYLSYPLHQDSEEPGFLSDFDSDSIGKSHTMVWPVDPKETELELVGLINVDNTVKFSKKTIYAPQEPKGGKLAYKLVQIDHYTQNNLGNSEVFYGYATQNMGDDNFDKAYPLLITKCPTCYHIDPFDYIAWDNDGMLFETLPNDFFTISSPNIIQDTLAFIDRYGTTQKVTLRNSINQDFVEIVP